MKKLFSLFAAVLFAGSMMADSFVPFDGALVEGDYLITYDGAAMKASIASDRLQYTEFTVTAGKVVDPAANVIWHLAKDGDNWTIYNADANKYAGSTSAKNKAALLANTSTDNSKWIVTGNATYEFENVARGSGSDPNNKWLRRNGTYGFACYANSTGGALTLYKKLSGDEPEPDVANFCLTEVGHMMEATPAQDSYVLLSIGSKGGKTIVRIDQDAAKNTAMFDYLQVTGIGSVGADVAEGGVTAMAYEFDTPAAVNDSLTLEVLWSTVNWAGRWMVQNIRVAIADCQYAVVPLVPITCAEVYSKSANAEIALNDVTVTYVNGINAYVKDASGSMLIYLPAAGTWKAGDVISGLEGKVAIYNGLYEVKPSADQVAAVAVTAGEAPAPVEMTAAPVADDMNKYVVLKNVSVSAASFPDNKNMDATIGEQTFILRNSFNANIAFDTEKTYDITGVVAVYNDNVQVYFISAEEYVAPVIPADRRIIAWDLKSVLNGDNYKFSYKSNIDGSEANLIFYNAGVEADRVALNAPEAGLNEYTMSKHDLPAGTLTWAIEVKAGDVENFAEFTDATRGIYNFYHPRGIAVNNCTESDYFGHMYITERDGASDGMTDRTKAQQGGIFEYDLALDELNATNQGWLPQGIVAGTDPQEIKRIAVDPKDGMIYYNSTSAIYKINPASITAAPTNVLANAEGITKVNACYAEEGEIFFMDNANTTDGGTLKKIAEDGTMSTILQSTTWGNQEVGICSDGRGGLWIAQNRWNIDVYSILTHVTSAGAIDFTVVKTSDDAVKALFPQSNNASQRGQLAYFAKENLLAFGGNKTAAVYKVTYDAESGVPSLALLYRSGTIGGNMDGFSFDYAGNLYFISASSERMYAYSIPTENNEVVVPAKSTLTVSSTATAIEDIYVLEVQKVIRNGQVLIIRDGKTYNMMGQIVE